MCSSTLLLFNTVALRREHYLDFIIIIDAEGEIVVHIVLL